MQTPTNPGELPEDLSFSINMVKDLKMGESGWISPAGAINTGKNGFYVLKDTIYVKEPYFPYFVLLIRTPDGLLADVSATRKTKFKWELEDLSEFNMDELERVTDIHIDGPIKLWAKVIGSTGTGTIKITPQNVSPVDFLFAQQGIKVAEVDE